MADLADRHQRPPEEGGGAAFVDQRELLVEEGVHEEDEFYQPTSPLVFGFDSFSSGNDSSNPVFLDDYTSSFDFGFAEDHDCDYEDSIRFFFGSLEDSEHMNFVTDLFEQRQVPGVEDPIWETDSSPVAASPMGIDFAFGGLRVVSVDSESDSDEFEVNSGYINRDEDDMYDSIETRIGGIHHAADVEGEEFEWEEVGDRIQFEDRENLNSVINRIEEISVSSDISSSEDAVHLGHDEEGGGEGNAVWEVLLEMNNLERNFELDILEENNDLENDVLQVDAPEDYIIATDFNALVGLLADNETALKGSPPASKKAVENLQQMVLTNKNVQEKKAVVSCAVCKDDFTLGERLTAMPCHHMYHGGCILPWLAIRNTCPVCRYELPTDDANYERRKGERGGHGAGIITDDEFPLRYNLEVLPL